MPTTKRYKGEAAPEYDYVALLDRIIGAYDALLEAESAKDAELVAKWRNLLSNLVGIARQVLRVP